MTRRILLQFTVLLLALAVAYGPGAFADGGKCINTTYGGQTRPKIGEGTWRFTISTTPILFYLGTVNKKYHVLVICVNSETTVPLNLAKDRDTIEVLFPDGQKVMGLLDLRTADTATWDGLEISQRGAVAYPKVIEPREEESICIYIPVDEVKGPRKTQAMPVSIIYTIDSLKASVVLRSSMAVTAD